MTQPVQEPTQGRMDQAQEFRTRQLFRRPATSGGGLPYAWIRRTTNATVLTGASFDTRTTTGNTFDDGDQSSTDFFAVNLTDGRIQINATGIYLVQLDVWWTSTDMPQVTFVHLNTGNTLETGGGTRSEAGSNYMNSTFNSWKNPSASMLTMIDALAVTATDNYFSLTASNYNASTRTIDSIYLNVVRLSSV